MPPAPPSLQSRSRRAGGHRIRSLVVLAALVVPLTAIGLAEPARADPIIPLTVRITKIIQPSGDIDPAPFHSPPAEFYAKITINGVTQSTFANRFDYPVEVGAGYIFPWVHIPPASWAVSRQVDSAVGSAAVSIELWDDDEGLFDDDDQADVSPAGGRALSLSVNLANGRWTGDIMWPSVCATGTSSDSATVCFDISTVSTTGDLDGDTLLDGWEQNGFNADGDATIDLDLPAFGADPRRTDVFVEIDCLADDDSGNGTIEAAEHTHCPIQNAMTDVVGGYANAPVTNPDGTTGVQLHLDTGALFGAGLVAVNGTGGVTGNVGQMGGGGTQIPENGNEVIDWDGATGRPATDFDTLKAANFAAGVRGGIFRYAIFGHQVNFRAATFDCTSGWAPTEDFIVSLGGQIDSNADGAGDGPCWGLDADGSHSVGTRLEQAGTFMHELGHPQNLDHGGGDAINSKPNYLSVMNYSFQMCAVPVSPAGATTPLPGGCDYSRFDVDLTESALDECFGIGPQFGFGPVDWDGDGTLEGPTCTPASGTVSVDLNGNGVGSSPGFDDWSNLALAISPGAGMSTGGHAEADPQAILQARQSLQAHTAPGVAVTVTGPATAAPGDVLTYSAVTSNSGPGPALRTTLNTTAPDGATQVVDLDGVVVGSSESSSVRYTVPADACPTTYTTSATVDFTSLAGFAGEASGQAQTQVVDVAPPRLKVRPSEHTLWPPNHKLRTVTFAIDADDNCDAHPTITLVSVTSSEPDDGFGDGHTSDDIQGAAVGTDDRSLLLRAERSGVGHGRTYTIVYRATDAGGNSTEATATVVVPK